MTWDCGKHGPSITPQSHTWGWSMRRSGCRRVDIGLTLHGSHYPDSYTKQSPREVLSAPWPNREPWTMALKFCISSYTSFEHCKDFRAWICTTLFYRKETWNSEVRGLGQDDTDGKRLWNLHAPQSAASELQMSLRSPRATADSVFSAQTLLLSLKNQWMPWLTDWGPYSNCSRL